MLMADGGFALDGLHRGAAAMANGDCWMDGGWRMADRDRISDIGCRMAVIVSRLSRHKIPFIVSPATNAGLSSILILSRL
jgi:hypothetical protein